MLVSALMSPIKLYVSQDLLNIGCIIYYAPIDRDLSRSFIWRRISLDWSYDGGKALNTFLVFVDILITSSRVTGIILPVSRRFVTTEYEEIYPWADM